MTKFLLDIIVNDAIIECSIPCKEMPFWIMIKTDGLPTTISTSMMKVEKKVVKWNQPSRLILDVPNINNAYMYIALCTLDQKTKQMKTIGVAKAKLAGFPVGKPRGFSVPLMQAMDSKSPAGKLHMTATISALFPSMPRYIPCRLVPGPLPSSSFTTC